MSAYVNRTRPRVPTELTVPMSAVSTPRARGGLCLAAGICPGWVEGMVAVGQTGARHPWISFLWVVTTVCWGLAGVAMVRNGGAKGGNAP